MGTLFELCQEDAPERIEPTENFTSNAVRSLTLAVQNLGGGRRLSMSEAHILL